MHLTLYQILALLRTGPLEASAILARLATMLSPPPSLPAFYRHLRRGVDDGWIEVVETNRLEARPGRPPQRYRITARGVGAVREEAQALQAFTRLALDGAASLDP